MKEFILVKNHMNAKCARKHSHNHLTSKHMKKIILEKIPFSAKHARKHFYLF